MTTDVRELPTRCCKRARVIPGQGLPDNAWAWGQRYAFCEGCRTTYRRIEGQLEMWARPT
jgi:hypothetical protein